MLALPGENSLWPHAPVGPEQSLPFGMPEHYSEIMCRAQFVLVRFTGADLRDWRRWWRDENVRCPPLVYRSGKDAPLVLAAFYWFGVPEAQQFVNDRCANCHTGYHPASLCPIPCLCDRCGEFGHVEFYDNGAVMCPHGNGGGAVVGVFPDRSLAFGDSETPRLVAKSQFRPHADLGAAIPAVDPRILQVLALCFCMCAVFYKFYCFTVAFY